MEQATPDTSGRTSRTPLAYFDPASCSWRTSPDIFGEASTLSPRSLPQWGIASRGGLFPLPKSAHPTCGSVSSSLLKTPTAQLATNGGSQHPEKRKRGGMDQPSPMKSSGLLPTPHANCSTGPGRQGREGGMNLQTAANLLTEKETDNAT